MRGTFFFSIAFFDVSPGLRHHSVYSYRRGCFVRPCRPYAKIRLYILLLIKLPIMETKNVVVEDCALPEYAVRFAAYQSSPKSHKMVQFPPCVCLTICEFISVACMREWISLVFVNILNIYYLNHCPYQSSSLWLHHATA